jgi:hypothetical protein
VSSPSPSASPSTRFPKETGTWASTSPKAKAKDYRQVERALATARHRVRVVIA